MGQAQIDYPEQRADRRPVGGEVGEVTRNQRARCGWGLQAPDEGVSIDGLDMTWKVGRKR